MPDEGTNGNGNAATIAPPGPGQESSSSKPKTKGKKTKAKKKVRLTDHQKLVSDLEHLHAQVQTDADTIASAITALTKGTK